jgi:hypothetical protein
LTTTFDVVSNNLRRDDTERARIVAARQRPARPPGVNRYTGLQLVSGMSAARLTTFQYFQGFARTCSGELM